MIVKWQQLLLPLGVGHFRITEVSILDECSDPEAAAGVSISDFYDTVSFEFDADELETATEDVVNERIIHEWLHVAWRDYDQAIAALFRWLPVPSRQDFEANINREYEGVLDRVARTIYAMFKSTC